MKKREEMIAKRKNRDDIFLDELATWRVTVY